MSDNTLKTKLVWDVSQAHGAAQRMMGDVSRMQSGIANLTSAAAAFGAAFITGRVMNGMRGFIASTAQAHTSIEQGTMALSSMIATADHLDFRTAYQGATSLYEQIDRAAAEAYGTTEELVDIFSQAMIPGRQLGLDNEALTGMTKQFANFAGMNGLMMQQVGNDVNEMLTGGVTGMTANKTFKKLRQHMGGITTQAFNQLDAATRLQRVTDALNTTVSPEAMEMIGQSWEAQTSTFKSAFNMLREKAFGAPFFGQLAKILGRITQVMQNPQLMNAAKAMGAIFLNVLDPIANKLIGWVDYAVNNWQSILNRMMSWVEKARAAFGIFKQAAIIYYGAKMAGAAGGALATGAGALASAGGFAIQGLMGGFAILQTACANLAMIMATSATRMGGVTVVLTNIFNALKAGAITSLMAYWPLIVAMLAIAGIVSIVATHWDSVKAALTPLVGLLIVTGESIWNMMQQFWAFIQPIAELVGGGLLLLLVGGFTFAVAAIRIFADVMSSVFQWLGQATEGMRSWVFTVVEDILVFLRQFGIDMGGYNVSSGSGQGSFLDDFMNGIRERMASMTTPTTPQGGAPGERGRHVTDMRGARITVKQEFKDANPDRVMGQMLDDINRQAVQRIQSGYSNPMG